MTCEHPVHSNPGLIIPCPECGEAPQPNTVTVRIAVAMDSHGLWVASSASNVPDATSEVIARGGLRDACAVVWVTATLPTPQPPEPQEVRGTVEQEDDA